VVESGREFLWLKNSDNTAGKGKKKQGSRVSLRKMVNGVAVSAEGWESLNNIALK